jgi:solute carrier family 35 protein E1
MALALFSTAAAFAPALSFHAAPLVVRPRLAVAPSMIEILEPVKRTANYLRGQGVSAEKVPCGDGEDDECYALCDEQGCSVVGEVGFLRTVKIGVYFALWFALSTGYNLQNKVRLNLLPLPWTQSAFSLFVGSAFVMPLWLSGIRKPPQLSSDAVKTLLPIAFCHSIGHIAAVVSASAGAVSFTQIVKAAEPVFTCFLSALILGSRIAPLTLLSLLPIVLGVALASMTELSFTWMAFGGAMLSNLAFAIRNICSRASMDKPKGKNMTPENLFGVLTVMSFLFALPLAAVMEGPKIAAVYAASALKASPAAMLKASIATGLYFYTYNEVAMLALNNVNPVTHAVANTMKRVVILLACIFFFRTPLTPLCATGSAIAIFGGYLYSLAKGREKAQAKA